MTGTIVTAVLQSSSLVNLLVLAFVGGGIISLQNSLGIVLGANLGTTFTAWIVATLGFKVKVAELSFPLLTLGLFSYMVWDKKPFLRNLGGFLIGFGLLFLGLDYMKVSIEEVAANTDFSRFSETGLWVFLLIGIIITALIQSSSAMIVIVLSALNAGVIDLHQSIAMVIGASIGTTSTLILGSIGGTPDKKRLSLANIIFKLVAGIISFFAIDQLIQLTARLAGVRDPLMELVILNTAINLIGILIFFPFIRPFGRLLNKWFKQAETERLCMFINPSTLGVPDVAIKNMQQELKHVMSLTHEFMQDCLQIKSLAPTKLSRWNQIFTNEVNPIIKYQHLKQLEDEITQFYTLLQQQTLTQYESDTLSSVMIRLRALIYAAKNMKDIIHNIAEIKESEDELAQEVLKKLQDFVQFESSQLVTYAYQSDKQKIDSPASANYELFYHETIQAVYHQLNAFKSRQVAVSTISIAIKKTVSALEELNLAVRPMEHETKRHIEAIS